MGVEDTKLWVLLDLEEDLEERLFGEKEESKSRRVGIGESGGDGNG